MQPDVLILTEHGLKIEHLKLVKIPNFSLITSFCRESHKMGGVSIFIHEDIEDTVEPICILDYCKELTCELAMIRLFLKKTQLFVVGVYRPPGGKIEDALDMISETLENTKAANQKVLIMGDINIDGLQEDKTTIQLKNMLSSHGIERLALPPTRITPTTKTSIDCVCTNLPLLETKTTVVTSGISDHTAQICTLEIGPQIRKTTNIICRSFKQQNLDTLNYLLKGESWQSVYGSQTAEESYNQFIELLTYSLNLACPKNKRQEKTQNKIFF